MSSKRFYLVIIFLFTFCQSLDAQDEREWEWQDPLDTTIGDLAEKWNVFYNVIGVAVSHYIAYDTLKLEGLKRDWYVSAHLDYQQEYKNRPPISNIYAARFRVETFIRPWLSFGIEGGPLFTTDTLQQRIGAGTTGVFNWHIVNAGRHKLNFENGFGTVLFDAPFPDRGSGFNFNYFYAFMYHLRINERTAFDIGFRNQHISNASLFKDENPGFDSYGVRFGFTKTFDKKKHPISPWKDSLFNPF